jgi:hypothetical protein
MTINSGLRPVLVAVGIALFIAMGTTAAAAGPECKCRANGQDYRQGQVLCIMAKLRRCEMFLNNTSWKIVADSCPQASLVSPALLLPHAIAMELPHSSRPGT